MDPRTSHHFYTQYTLEALNLDSHRGMVPWPCWAWSVSPDSGGLRSNVSRLVCPWPGSSNPAEQRYLLPNIGAVGSCLECCRFFGDNGLTLKVFFTKAAPFGVLWTLTNYLYLHAIKKINTTDVSVLFCCNKAFVFLLSWIVLRDRFMGVRLGQHQNEGRRSRCWQWNFVTCKALVQLWVCLVIITSLINDRSAKNFPLQVVVGLASHIFKSSES
ncbi:hypothetical protein MC885_018601 [Smutsia gigantea]|nr:hypothetical protein MC885_018601 [Smutsia gigantea]